QAVTGRAPRTTEYATQRCDRGGGGMAGMVGEMFGEPGCVSAGRTRGATQPGSPMNLGVSAQVSSREGLRQLVLGDDDHALLGHLESSAAIVFRIVTDGRVRRDFHVLVDNGAAAPAVPAEVHALKQGGILDQGKAVGEHAG